ncbi:HNH endonuclease [Kutzneria buriramensis]|uniref:5-methylcytosine-specific restriction protein A n=1 Tax=Kutzneria buriramensis TaxID=1045776 RepID=A0A3E0HEJ2_9PSEU|nr:HNH endonuclease [Kutzneria buriramensis]REH43630.1 5-methylcytosine-specific restriction protein A [Kutzneria buriramensis]
MPLRPCLDCSALHRNRSRCDSCQARWDRAHDAGRGSATERGYDAAYQRLAGQIVAEHRGRSGDWCPGWQRPAHQATDLTADHIVPLAAGGSNEQHNLAVLCRSCNSAKRERQADGQAEPAGQPARAGGQRAGPRRADSPRHAGYGAPRRHR